MNPQEQILESSDEQTSSPNFKSHHFTDKDGNPSGGTTYGRGFNISWQNGPLAVEGERVEPNGAFVEDIIKAAIDRIEFYQRTKFQSAYNAGALLNLRSSLELLQLRTRDREQRGVEGTHAA